MNAAALWWRAARAAYGVGLRALPARVTDPLRDLVARNRHRLPDFGGGGGRIPVPGVPTDPVVLVVATGSDPKRLAELVAHLAGCRVRPVWLVDTSDPAALADHVVEWLAPASTIKRAGFDPDTVRAARLTAIHHRYRPSRVVIVGPDGPLPDRVLVGYRP